MTKWEKSIREKVHASGILTNGEWVYLVGVFQAANELDDVAKENERLRKRVDHLEAAYVRLETD